MRKVETAGQPTIKDHCGDATGVEPASINHNNMDDAMSRLLGSPMGHGLSVPRPFCPTHVPVSHSDACRISHLSPNLGRGSVTAEQYVSGTFL